MSKEEMVTYSIVLELKNTGMLKPCMTKGIIPTYYTTWLEVYEYFKKENKTETSKMQCYTNTATNFNICESSVRNIVSRFES